MIFEIVESLVGHRIGAKLLIVGDERANILWGTIHTGRQEYEGINIVPDVLFNCIGKRELSIPVLVIVFVSLFWPIPPI